MAYQMKQYTNFSTDFQNADDYDYHLIVNKKPVTKKYKTIKFNNPIVQFGYNCEPKGITYPIFIEQPQTGFKPFYINKGCIFEVQPQTVEKYVINENFDPREDPISKVCYVAETYRAELCVTAIRIPTDIDFILDITYAIN